MATAEERDLEVLLKTEERFPPPPEFAEQANANDPAIYDEAERDFEAWWAGWAEKPPKTTLCVAPIRAQASIAAGVSGIIGM